MRPLGTGQAGYKWGTLQEDIRSTEELFGVKITVMLSPARSVSYQWSVCLLAAVEPIMLGGVCRNWWVTGHQYTAERFGSKADYPAVEMLVGDALRDLRAQLWDKMSQTPFDLP